VARSGVDAAVNRVLQKAGDWEPPRRQPERSRHHDLEIGVNDSRSPTLIGAYVDHLKTRTSCRSRHLTTGDRLSPHAKSPRTRAIGLAPAAALLVFGCGPAASRTSSSSSDKGGGDGNGAGSSCSVTLSGSLSRTLACTASGGAAVAGDRGAVNIWAGSDPDGASGVVCTIFLSFDSVPAARTYTSTDPDATGTITVLENAITSWTAGTGSSAAGSYTLVVTSVVETARPRSAGTSRSMPMCPAGASNPAGDLTVDAVF
jgi:hypothetical protein